GRGCTESPAAPIQTAVRRYHLTRRSHLLTLPALLSGGFGQVPARRSTPKLTTPRAFPIHRFPTGTRARLCHGYRPAEPGSPLSHLPRLLKVDGLPRHYRLPCGHSAPGVAAACCPATPSMNSCGATFWTAC